MLKGIMCWCFSIVRYVTGETTMKEGVDINAAPEKALIEQEQELLEKYKVNIPVNLFKLVPIKW